jgi:hypothetical protein
MESKRQNRKSLYFYQKALVSELENFSDSSIYRNPDVNRIEPQISLLRILKGKAKSFSELYDENKKSVILILV